LLWLAVFDDVIEQERRALQGELERKDEEITNERRRADTLRRRQRLVVLTLALAAVFVLVGLAVGLRTAWAYVVAVGVLVGLVVAGDQLIERLKR
jgi:Flp pilus assembly protein TadB